MTTHRPGDAPADVTRDADDAPEAAAWVRGAPADDPEQLADAEGRLWRYATEPTNIHVEPFPTREDVLMLLAELHRIRTDRARNVVHVETSDAQAVGLHDALGGSTDGHSDRDG